MLVVGGVGGDKEGKQITAAGEIGTEGFDWSDRRREEKTTGRVAHKLSKTTIDIVGKQAA